MRLAPSAVHSQFAKGGTVVGRLEVVTGCMFSGKTEELIRRLHLLQYAHQLYLLFKPSMDDRYGRDKVSTHYGRVVDAYLLEPGKETLEKLVEIVGYEALDDAHVVAFDEAQFFSSMLPSLCEELVRLGKRVIVAGLDTNFRNEPFGPTPALLALADEAVKLKAVCIKCGQLANRTQRLVNGEPAKRADPEVVVGGAEAYEARCRQCYEPPK